MVAIKAAGAVTDFERRTVLVDKALIVAARHARWHAAAIDTVVALQVRATVSRLLDRGAGASAIASNGYGACVGALG